MYQETNSDHTTHLIMFNHSDFTDKDPTKLNKQQTNTHCEKHIFANLWKQLAIVLIYASLWNKTS